MLMVKLVKEKKLAMNLIVDGDFDAETYGGKEETGDEIGYGRREANGGTGSEGEKTSDELGRGGSVWW